MVEKNLTLEESYSENGTDMAGLGLNTIATDKKEYHKGDSFTFRLRQVGKVQGIIWYYDGYRTTSSSVTLTSGKHRIKAVINHYDGSRESLYLTLDVK